MSREPGIRPIRGQRTRNAYLAMAIMVGLTMQTKTALADGPVTSCTNCRIWEWDTARGLYNFFFDPEYHYWEDLSPAQLQAKCTPGYYGISGLLYRTHPDTYPLWKTLNNSRCIGMSVTRVHKRTGNRRTYTVTSVGSTYSGPKFYFNNQNIYAGYRSRATTYTDGEWFHKDEHFGPEEPDLDPDKNHDPCLLAGNPVSIKTGHKIKHETDFTGRSPASLLRFARRYSSAENREGSAFGEHWRHTYSRRIDGLGSGSPQSVELVRHSGNRYTFTRQGDGTWGGDPDVRLQLRADSAGWTVTDTGGTVERYSSSGTLLRMVSPAGAWVSLSHDAQGRLARAEAPGGQGLDFQYDQEDRIDTVSTPDGELYYEYDVNGELHVVVRPDGSTRNYHYDDSRFPGALTGVTDANGVRIGSWDYDDQGRVTRSRGPDGVDQTRLSYHDDGSTTVTNALGKDTTYHFDTFHGVRRVSLVEGHPTPTCESANRQYSYTDEGWIATATDWNGNKTAYEHNDRGLETVRIEAVGTAEERTVTTDWHETRPLPTRSVEPHRITEKGYDESGRLTSRTITDRDTGESRVWQYAYHADTDNAPGPLARVTGPRADVDDATHFEYDAAGNLIRVTNALGHVMHVTAHDAGGRPLRVLDPNGVTTELSYDSRGRLIRVAVDGATTGYDYDAVGNLTGITRPNGSRLRYHYDPARRLVTIEDALGNRIDYTLDAAGNRTAERIRDGSGTLRYQRDQVFDELSRLRRITGSAGQMQRYDYDANDNLVSETDPSHNTTAHAFDALDRLIRSTDALQGQTVYGYDEQDTLTDVVDPRSNATRYTYNAFGDLIRLESPDSGISTFTYDSAGNRIRRTDAKGQVTTYAYDALNRLITVRYTNDPDSNVHHTYDGAASGYGIGRLTAIRDAAGVTRYSYNAHGQVVRKTRRSANGFEVSVGYGYDIAGELSRVIYPGGATVRYERDRAGLIRRVVLEQGNRRQVLADDLEYSPFGPLRTFTYGNGLPFSRKYDRDYRLTTLVSGPEYRRYAQDAAGNVVAIAEPDTPSQSQDFGYDALHRLISAAGEYGSLAYDYDPLGNRLSKQGPDGDRRYRVDAGSNRLLAIDNDTLRLDANGNLLRQGGNTFTYDPENRLTAVLRGGERVGAYTYNARHLRSTSTARIPVASLADPSRRGQTAPAQSRRPDHAGRPDHTGGGPTRLVTTHFVYNPNGRLLAELDRHGRVLRKYIWLEDMPLSLVDRTQGPARTAYYHTNHLNTPQTLTDARGNIVWAARYRPFGEAEILTASITNNLRFPGQYFDQETGLHYNWHRYYDPATGRYTTSDPIGLEGGVNTYAYVGGNPLTDIDPMGLQAVAGAGGPTGLFPLHPSFIPGTPESDQRVESTIQGIDSLGDMLGHIMRPPWWPPEIPHESDDSKTNLVCEVEQPVSTLPNAPRPESSCFDQFRTLWAGCARTQQVSLCRAAATAYLAACLSTGGFDGPQNPNPDHQ